MTCHAIDDTDFSCKELKIGYNGFVNIYFHICSWLCCYMHQMNPLVGPVLHNRTLVAVQKLWVSTSWYIFFRVASLVALPDDDDTTNVATNYRCSDVLVLIISALFVIKGFVNNWQIPPILFQIIFWFLPIVITMLLKRNVSFMLKNKCMHTIITR